jgi:hypothetical protein
MPAGACDVYAPAALSYVRVPCTRPRGAVPSGGPCAYIASTGSGRTEYSGIFILSIIALAGAGSRRDDGIGTLGGCGFTSEYL